MAGNVWEWCADWYGHDYYSKSPAKNPTGPADGSARVLRGAIGITIAFTCVWRNATATLPIMGTATTDFDVCQIFSRGYNAPIHSADLTIDLEIQSDKTEAIKKAGQDDERFFHQVMLPRRAEEARQTEQLRLTVVVFRYYLVIDGQRTSVMDNAGGGQRGLRATPSLELLQALSDYYGLNCGNEVVDLGGSSNLNLLVGDADRRYVLRAYRPYVTEDRLTDIQLVRHELSTHGVNCSEIVSTLSGQPWIAFDGRLVEVEHYVERDADMDSWERIQTGLPVLGMIHTILRDVEVSADAKFPIFANYIEPRQALNKTLQGTRRIREWNPSLSEQRLADAAEELADFVSKAERELITRLPRQLVHGDFWDKNVFFRRGHVALVADFDFMGQRTRIDDLALTLYLTCLKFLEHPLSDDYLQRVSSLVAAYDSGLDHPLTSEERAALPLAIIRQPLWSVGGWVALLDEETSARRHAASIGWEVEWALGLVDDIDRWMLVFA